MTRLCGGSVTSPTLSQDVARWRYGEYHPLSTEYLWLITQNLKGKLVEESALNYISRLYELPHHLKAPASALEAILASSRNVAEIFEAYIAAIFHDNIPT